MAICVFFVVSRQSSLSITCPFVRHAIRKMK